MTVPQVEELIQPDFDWLPNTTMVAIENTVNKGGGSVYTIEEMQAISHFCRSKKLIYHLDGARIFNALAALNKKPLDLMGLFDSISICISKGLGAPVGSVLVGSKAFIKKSRKLRKVMGGGMRQSGLLAAACIYALDNNVNRLAEDHQRARQLAETLGTLPCVKKVLPVETNIVIFEVTSSSQIAELLAAQGIKVQPFSPTLVRMVTHLDFTGEMLKTVITGLKNLSV